MEVEDGTGRSVLFFSEYKSELRKEGRRQEVREERRNSDKLMS